MSGTSKPVVLITGASGNIGGALCRALKDDYTIVGLDIRPCDHADISAEIDLTDLKSMQRRLNEVRNDCGDKIAAVIHLAAYFDFTGEYSPLYKKVNENGTRNLLKALKDFKVERFIYSGTMLVHKPGVPGRKISERNKIDPKWAYPESKAATEEIIKKHHGKIPYTILRLAGLYDEHTAVPTLAQQIARIYERDFKSHVYSGNTAAGQAFLHKDDMIDAFVRTVKRRRQLPKTGAILIGEDFVYSYQELQNSIGHLIYGADQWKTLEIPEPIAAAGAWAEVKSEPVVPDAIDKGQKPFIRPFMIKMSSDHYSLNISKAEKLLGWTPNHRIDKELPKMVKNLQSDAAKWYDDNGILKPDWMETVAEKNGDPDTVKVEYEAEYTKQHTNSIWAHFLNIALAFWLMTGPVALGYESDMMRWSDMMSGVLLLIFGSMSLSAHMGFARWVCAAIGFWVLSAPLIFWAPSAAAYLNGNIIGMLIIGFAVLTRPAVGVSPAAAMTGPTIPPGWEFNPSSWFQRAPIIALAFVGFFISRYLTAYQLGHIDAVWEPFFTGAAANAKNGTEEIITSSVSEAWPVPDAGLGALTYMLEIVTGLIGSSRRWRTMPWLVMAFGIMIVPLGAVSITFIIIQPIVIGTWCSLCLIGAAAMLIQIPYSFDELVATTQFLYRRKKAGKPLLKVFFTGDTDDGETQRIEDNFQQPPGTVIKDMLTGGVNMPWNLVVCGVIGLWLMFTRLTFGSEGMMANGDHLVGALVITIVVTAFAESARMFRFLILPLGAALLFTPFMYDAGMAAMINSMICGVALMALSLPRGAIYNHYGIWDKYIK